jgi:hypothetical protein
LGTGQTTGAGIRKLVFTYYLPLSAKLERDFYIPELSAEGFEVEYWDLTKVFFTVSLPEGIQRKYVRFIATMSEFKALLSHEDKKDTLFISQMTIEFRTLRLYRVFKRFGCKVATFDRPGYPVADGLVIRGLFFSKLFAFSKYPSYIRTVLTRFAVKTGYVSNFAIVFAAGVEALKRNRKAAKLIAVNHFDYDAYLCMDEEAVNPVGEDYAVFLDEQFPLHPDLKLLRMESLDPEVYFSQMNALFGRIERQYGLKVVVAGHPKTVAQGNPYTGFALIKHKTMALVKHSVFVIAHESTSISYAVIYRKPLLSTYTLEMERLYGDSILPQLRLVARLLGAVPRSTVESLPDYASLAGGVDETLYAEYESKFLSSGSGPGLSTQRAIAEALRKDGSLETTAH